jgi:hypothetical protein
MLLDLQKKAKIFKLQYDLDYHWSALMIAKDDRSANFQNRDLKKVLDYLWNYFYENKKGG